MTQQPRTPTTAAERKLLERESLNSRAFALITAGSILAIEAEARADLLAQIENAVLDREPPRYKLDGRYRAGWGMGVADALAAIRSAAPVEPT